MASTHTEAERSGADAPALGGLRALVIGTANEHSIGWGCARSMYRAGAQVAMTYLNESTRPHVEPLAREVRAPILLPFDVRDSTQADALFNRIESVWRGLDIVVHGIGYAPPEALSVRLADCPRTGFLTAMEVSCWSLLDIARRAEKHMRSGGTIITLSYIGSNSVIDNYGVMGPVKAALESCVRYLASELGPKIRVHAISPGPIATRASHGIHSFEHLTEQVIARAPGRRLVTIDEVGALATFLASPPAAGMTGNILYVDAGYHVMG